MTHYDTLGITQDATQIDIKTAYRKKAKEFHPDMNREQDTSEIFKKIQEAYDVLKDNDKKKHYDDMLAYQSSRIDTSETNGVRDILQTVNVVISLSQAINGCRKNVTYYHSVYKDVIKNITCPRCNGTGYMTFSIFSVPCPLCAGYGKVKLKSHKITKAKQTAIIRIPQGIMNGDVLKCTANDETIRLNVTIRPTKTISCDGMNIHVIKKISKKTLCRGGKTIIKTPLYKTRVSIPPDTKSGTVLLLKGKGLDTRMGKGDLFLKVIARE